METNARHEDNVVVVGETGKESLDKTTLAHLGFHAHPTKTPTITATQRGAMNIINSLNTSTIVGRCKISNKAETKAISELKQKDPDNKKLHKTKKEKEKVENPSRFSNDRLQSTDISRGFQ
jgi:hypothetical protein